MSQIIDGKAVSAKVREGLKGKAAELTAKGVKPGLAVVLAGDDPASAVYVRNKEKAANELGFYSKMIKLPSDVSEEELLNIVRELNNDEAIHGILVQLPLPKGLDEKKVIAEISPEKDVDAFHVQNVGKIMLGEYDFLPCTPAGVMELLKEYGIQTRGKNAVVIGRSNIVGKPMAMLLMHADATVTICHSKTENLADITRHADILIAAIGKAKFITGDMVKEGAVVIDVGMNRDENNKLCGDVDFDSVSEKASFITPVPGGVGPMTIAMLMKNTVKSAENKLLKRG